MNKIIISSFFIALTFFACKNENKQTKSNFETTVNNDFNNVKKSFVNDSNKLFDVFNEKLTSKETKALKFLYAYMPLNDLADYDGEFFLNQVRTALATRDTFSWGKDIPDVVFRHFVLPYRVNNENLDSARMIFFKELYPRIKDMSMEDAALEVNHWCHEKVKYQPTSSRTIAPTGAIQTAYGRCGEESTFTVTALRSVGIPARQVYTPRWAHVDDNHAWVEVFVNGKWKYLGACEPEPELNIGWFDGPVLRAMMVHTKTFGKYAGNEDIFNKKPKYTTLNTLNNYTITKNIWVKAVDNNNKPLKDAKVEFGLYNYAEFYPVKTVITKTDGLAHLKTGLGDLQIFISDKNNNFAIKKISVADIDTISIKLNKKIGDKFTLNIENVPPVYKEPVKKDAKGEAINKKRLAQEDSIRETYVATFYTKEKAKKLAEKLNLDASKLTPLMIESRGNYKEIEKYLNKAVQLDKKNTITLLNVISKKDLHDIKAATLLNHLKNYKIFNNNKYTDEISSKYILNPRIYLEGVRPYRKFCKDLFKNIVSNDVNVVANEVKEWINKNIKTNDTDNYYKVSISPMGAYKIKAADKFSKKLFFVSAMRSLGIPARLEPATLTAQYFNSNDWNNIYINAKKESAQVQNQGEISLTSSKQNTVEPLYQIHFSISRYINGRFETLLYDWEKPLKDFPKPLKVEPGYYCLLTGNRLPDGTVMVKEKFFNVEANKSTELVVELNKDTKVLKPIEKQEVVKTDKKAEIVGWINPETEPGNHFLNDFSQQKNTFESLNIKMRLYTNSQNNITKLKKEFSDNHNIIIDENWKLLNKLYKDKKLNLAVDLPIFIIITPDNNIYYKSSGYNIGTSEQLLKVYNKLNK